MFYMQIPVDPPTYDGVFVADRLGNACIQDRGTNWLWLTHPGWNRYFEDCLNLDVYTPEVRMSYDIGCKLHVFCKRNTTCKKSLCKYTLCCIRFFSSQLSLQNMSPDEPYPVMVFWHGGAFNTGSSIQYPGHFLAARDVIVVVPNYRLGVFGNV